jgi:hypothetical protein
LKVWDLGTRKGNWDAKVERGGEARKGKGMKLEVKEGKVSYNGR